MRCSWVLDPEHPNQCIRQWRGGVRVIDYWAPVDSVFYMLYCYAKSEQGDLTTAQAKVLGRLAPEEFT